MTSSASDGSTDKVYKDTTIAVGVIAGCLLVGLGVMVIFYRKATTDVEMSRATGTNIPPPPMAGTNPVIEGNDDIRTYGHNPMGKASVPPPAYPTSIIDNIPEVYRAD
jgi:hypothetical protein